MELFRGVDASSLKSDAPENSIRQLGALFYFNIISCPVRYGSSPKLLNLRPLSGVRLMSIVGASRTWAFLLRVSAPRMWCPIFSTSSGLKVAASEMPHGTNVVCAPSVHVTPHTPAGLSVVLRLLMLRRLTLQVSHMFLPATRWYFSSRVRVSKSPSVLFY